MWGNNSNTSKRSESDEFPAAPPVVSRVPETNVIKPTPVSAEGTVVSATRPVSGMVAGASARLGGSLHIRGEISGNEDLHVDGSVEGLIQLDERKLTIGTSAKVTADVVAREIVIYGSVKGNLHARERIEIKKDGSVIGDLTTARIMIEDGAYFKGSVEIDRKDSENGNDVVDKPGYTRSSSALIHATTAKSV